MTSKTTPRRALLITFILGLIVTSIGSVLYYTATVSNLPPKIPAGGIDIWAGPYQRANVTATWFTASVVERSITIEVEFGCPQYNTMHFYAILPFKVLKMDAYLRWNSELFYSGDNRTRRLGEINANFHISPVNGATIIDESFTPNASFFFFDLSVMLGVKLYVDQLVARSEGATDTVVLTFAGTTLIEDDMTPYMQTDTQPVWNQPLLLFVEFPPSAFFSANSFPSPAEYFVTAQYRSVFYNLNFTYQTPHVSLGQSILCSFNYPAQEQGIQQRIFLGGLLIGLGAPLLIAIFIEFIRSDRRSEDEIGRTAQQDSPSLIAGLLIFGILVAILAYVRSANKSEATQ